MADQTTNSGESSTAIPSRVMVDIETLGLEPGSVITSIGAVRFTSAAVGQTFSRRIDIESATDAGLTIDGGTLQWWLEQSEDAREELHGDQPLRIVLEAFANWLGDVDELWANSPSFDCEHLEAAYDAVGLDVPWDYYHERDYRTLSNLPVAPDIEQEGVEHNALDDAIHQATVASKALQRAQMLDGVDSTIRDGSTAREDASDE